MAILSVYTPGGVCIPKETRASHYFAGQSPKTKEPVCSNIAHSTTTVIPLETVLRDNERPRVFDAKNRRLLSCDSEIHPRRYSKSKTRWYAHQVINQKHSTGLLQHSVGELYESRFVGSFDETQFHPFAYAHVHAHTQKQQQQQQDQIESGTIRAS